MLEFIEEYSTTIITLVIAGLVLGSLGFLLAKTGLLSQFVDMFVHSIAGGK